MANSPRIQVRLDPDTKDQLERLAEEEEMSVSTLVRRWIKQRLATDQGVEGGD